MADVCPVPDGFNVKKTPGWLIIDRVLVEGEAKAKWTDIKHWNYFCEQKSFKALFDRVKKNYFSGKLQGVDGISTPRSPTGEEVPLQFHVWNCSDEAKLLQIGQNLVDTLGLKGSIYSPYMYLRERDSTGTS